MAAIKWVVTDRHDDRETGAVYQCDCGYQEYLSETCNCPTCADLRNQNKLPLSNCPECNEPFMKEE